MRVSAWMTLLIVLPSTTFAQTKAIQDAAEHKLTTARYVQSLQDPNTGAFRPAADAKTPGLRATLAAARSLKYLTGKPIKDAVPHADKAAAFVLSCYDPKTGGFADTPGGKPDVMLTSIGIMAAVDLGISRDKFRKAMDYLKENAKTFEEVRLGAAAVEAWGVKACPFDLNDWQKIADRGIDPKLPPIANGGARLVGSLAAFTLRLRLHKETDTKPAAIARLLDRGQLPDGGWCETDAKTSDLGTTYRVMRAYFLLKDKPKDVAKLREFITQCRNKDGGYGVKPGTPSTVGAVYYAAIITHWLEQPDNSK